MMKFFMAALVFAFATTSAMAKYEVTYGLRGVSKGPCTGHFNAYKPHTPSVPGALKASQVLKPSPIPVPTKRGELPAKTKQTGLNLQQYC